MKIKQIKFKSILSKDRSETYHDLYENYIPSPNKDDHKPILDNNGRIIELESKSLYGRKIQYVYDKKGNMIQHSYFKLPSDKEPFDVLKYKYNANDEPTQEVFTREGEKVHKIKFVYPDKKRDENGNWLERIVFKNDKKYSNDTRVIIY